MSKVILGKVYTVENKYGICEYSFETEYVHIYNLFVQPEYRLKGIARVLLETAIKEIKETGHDGEILIVTTSAKLALFYKRLGLKVYSYYW